MYSPVTFLSKIDWNGVYQSFFPNVPGLRRVDLIVPLSMSAPVYSEFFRILPDH
jgi:hypothetical protein